MRLAIRITILAVLATRAYAWFPQWSAKMPVEIPGDATLVVADMNGDGRPDAVVRAATKPQQLLLSVTRADATLAPPTVIYQSDSLGDVLAAEVTGDSRSDLIVSNSAVNSIIALPSNGDGTIGSPIVSAVTATPAQLASADFNGDGNLDLAVLSRTSSLVMILAGDGSGHFAEISRSGIGPSGYSIITGDADGDGRADVLTAHYAPWQHEVRFGQGDGSLTAPVLISAPPAAATVRLADLDHDGDSEIISADYDTATVTVWRNSGSRTFAAPDTYVVSTGSPVGDPGGLVVADVNGDGHNDAVVTLSYSRMLATLCGGGTGTLNAPAYAYAFGSGYSTYPSRIAAADLNADGRPDLIVTARSLMTSFLNASGDVRVMSTLTHPTISVGQKAGVVVELRTAAGYVYPGSFVPPFPTGLVSLRKGTSDVAPPLVPQNRQATFEVASLPAGDHELTAAFAGDDQYRPGSSAPVVQHVVNQQTAVAITSSVGEASVPWSAQWTLTASVTSPIAKPLDGPLSLYVDGVKSSQSATGPRGNWSMPMGELTIGEHEFQVAFDGTAAQPPSVSATYRKLVTKAPTVTFFADYASYTAKYGEQPQLRVAIGYDSPGGHTPSGIVRVYDGTTEIASRQGDGFFTVPVLKVGVHNFTAAYEGDALWEGSRSAAFRYEVVSVKTPTTTRFSSGESYTVRYGEQLQLRVEVIDASGSGHTPAGTVRILDGTTIIYSMDGGGTFTVPVLPAGVHTLTAVFVGNSLWEGSRSAPVRYEVLQGNARRRAVRS